MKPPALMAGRRRNIEIAALELARRHVLGGGPPSAVPSWSRVANTSSWLTHARVVLAEPEGPVAKAAEWLLDNEYIVHRAALQVQEDLPQGFYRQLPTLAGRGADALPRIIAVAREILGASQLQLSLSTLTHFIDAYQEQAILTTAELWALPTALRLACLELLVDNVERLVPQLAAPFEIPATPHPPLGETECVARALGNLRVIASISWKDFFQAQSRVEKVLRRDPSGVYSHMDFETADRYRRTVEALAKATTLSEIEVASRVVSHAQRFAAVDARRSHVGFWLIDDGRAEFESSLGYRASASTRLWRWLGLHRESAYCLALVGGTLGALLLPAWYLTSIGASPLAWVGGIVAATVPASVLGITAVHWLITLYVQPRVLPKLDLDDRIPEDCKTAIVVPSLTGSRGDVARLLESLERHYLASPKGAVEFVLLSDFPDARVEHMSQDDAVLDALASGIAALNRRYAGAEKGPFHALHRPRRFNAAEDCWMGWERKRGKLEEFNRLLRSDSDSAFSLHVGDPSRLGGIRFVVTLDTDTAMARDSLTRLVGTVAHPLNEAQFDEETGRVVSGYTVVQPRVEIDPASGGRSRFTRLFAGDTAIDIYSRAVSDVYQDLFGAGIYIGKGIYEVDSFRRSLEGRVPENALASHDLFEGVHGRAALATDIVLYESFPARYIEFTRRMHRWVRGDWQLLPWLGRTVPGADGRRLPNRLGAIDRWKIGDNLRRSLVAPALLVMLAGGWLMLPGNPWLWTLLGLLAPAGHLFTDLVSGFARGRRRSAVRSALRRLRDHASRWVLLVVFLPYEAGVAVDAIVRALLRLFVTRRKLLEWTTAAETARRFTGASRIAEWRTMWLGPGIAVLLGTALWWIRPDALLSAALLLGLWLVSPEVAYRASRERPESGAAPLSNDDRRFLRQLARRSWLFFETFAGPEDQWLPPDNYQEDPGGITAHRTSPTNIGMMFLSSLTAWDLGYLGTGELASRLRNSIETLKKMEHYRGHLFNWYETRSLEPLEPRYVSTVDSGNLAASLIALKEGCLEIARGPALCPARWDGLVDVLTLFEASVEKVGEHRRREPLRRMVRRMQEQAQRARANPADWAEALEALSQQESPNFALALREAIAASEGEIEVAALHEVRIWLDRAHQQIREMHRETTSYAPWSHLWSCAPEPLGALAAELAAVLPPSLPIPRVPERVAQAREQVVQSRATYEASEWLDAVTAALDQGEQENQELDVELRSLAAEAERAALSMNFRWLYDPQTRLFHIGANVSADRIDSHHYDLLASEARLASIFAIAKGDAPVEHWFHLGRSITNAAGKLCLVSWGGSMFEYLMPALLLRSEPGTLLAQSERSAVEKQRQHGAELGVPWGVSESGFAALDADRNYRYRAFGVPGLGLRRRLDEDLVVAPYATVLALRCATPEAIENLRKLVELGLMGEYGLFEAADFTPARVPEGRELTPVSSYMAHHQGMILAALDNALCGDVLVRRMHRDPRMRSVDLLLHERVPAERPLELLPRIDRPELRPSTEPAPTTLPAWSPDRSHPALHVLGNGRLSTAITASGSGGLHWNDYALTRWTPDPTRETQGIWVYVRDEESGQRWRTAPEDDGPRNSVVFHGHLAEFHRSEHGIGVRMEVAVAPADDMEIRRLTIVNETDRPRVLTFTSYTEIVLGRKSDDERHPAFSKLFVCSEWLGDLSGLLFTRRPRGPEECPPVLLHRLVADSPNVTLIGFEGDRRTFLGRGHDAQAPDGLVRSADSSVGVTLDSVASLCVRVELPPDQTEHLYFVTGAAGSRESVLEVAERHQTPSALDWVMDDAATESMRVIQRIGLEGKSLPALQRLASLLVYPHGAFRCASPLMERNRLGQPRLWGMGLSGDLPILLVTARDPEHASLLQDLLRAHRFWRGRGLAVDLVVLREGASGYVEPVGERLLELLQDLGAREQLGRNGGVHFVVADQLNEEDRTLLLVAARVLLDVERGPLEHQISNGGVRSELPDFTPSRWDVPSEPTPPVPRPTELRFDNGYGGFSPDGREYVIHLEPGRSTPAPWSNVLANERFGTLVTESGCGFTWAMNSGENRLTPWTNDPVSDRAGEILYLRDEETGTCWSPTPAPAGQSVAHEIRHAAGRTTWRSNREGLEQTLQVFVPPLEPVKVIRLRVHNRWNRPRRITATYYAEWVLGSQRGAGAHFLVPEYSRTEKALLVRNPWAPDFAERVAFLTASEEPHGVTADRTEFFGQGGTLSAPAALRRWGLGGRVEPGVDSCAALQVHLDLAPDETREIHFALGQGDDREHSLELVRRWRDPQRIERALEQVADFWETLLGSVQVKTPDPSLDLMLNHWLLYQTLASRLFARSGFYQSGGAIGFRDQLQDALALVHVAPERLRLRVVEAAAHQFEEGDVLHWWHPPAARGVRTRCADDLLWLPYATGLYVDATGDEAVLDEKIPFLTGHPLSSDELERYALFERGAECSLFEHCERALERGVSRGPHDLPLIGTGDWNDGMNRVGIGGIGESIWLGWFAIAAIRQFVGLCQRRGRRELANHWQRRMIELERAVESNGWDGEWYRRAIDDSGQPWGSSESEECRIDSIAQSWSVLSASGHGAWERERARKALDAAEAELVREQDGLVALLWPPFDATLRDPGYIKAYPPGIRENGGQYTHAATWLGWAFAELGEGDRAVRILRLINPIGHALESAAAERYRVEPYVLAADVASVSPHVGRGGWTWYTGASAWAWRLGVEAILGLRRVDGDIRFDPCLPTTWGRAEVRIRGVAGDLIVSIEDPERVGRGVVGTEVDGEPIADERIRVPRDGRDRHVVVRLGRPAPD